MALMATSPASDQGSDFFWKDGTGASGCRSNVRATPPLGVPQPSRSGTESAFTLVVDGVDTAEPPETTSDFNLVWATMGTVVEISSEIVTVESSDGMTLDLPLSVFVEQPEYGSPVRYEVRRRSNGTRYQECRVLPDSGSPEAMAAMEEILSRF